MKVAVSATGKKLNFLTIHDSRLRVETPALRRAGTN
jgi:hypothetical protein